MRLTATRILFGYPFLLLSLLSAPTVAHAQPADDPGLSEPTPPPPPPPTPTPAPAPKPAAKPQPQPSARGSSTALTPAQQTVAPPPEVSETTDTKVEWIADKEKSA